MLPEGEIDPEESSQPSGRATLALTVCSAAIGGSVDD